MYRFKALETRFNALETRFENQKHQIAQRRVGDRLPPLTLKNNNAFVTPTPTRATQEQKGKFYIGKSRKQLTGAAREILSNAGSPIQNENTEIFSPKTGIFSPKNRTPYYQQSLTPDPKKMIERFKNERLALRLEGA